MPELLDAGHHVRCLVENPDLIRDRNWETVDVRQGNILLLNTLEEVFHGIDIVYYFSHYRTTSLLKTIRFDQQAANNIAQAVDDAGVKRIIYLSKHWNDSDDRADSRADLDQDAGAILASGPVPVTIIRTSLVIGSGSVGFEIIRHLVRNLPVIFCPRWMSTPVRPIGIQDLLHHLVAVLEIRDNSSNVTRIGPPETTCYRELLRTAARRRGFKRVLIPVPFMLTRLSAYSVSLVTSIPYSIAYQHLKRLECDDASRNCPDEAHAETNLIPFEQVLNRAYDRWDTNRIGTFWSDDEINVVSEPMNYENLKRLVLEKRSLLPAEALFEPIRCIGGETGWYYLNWVWRVRGFIDKVVGGVGLRRGRRSRDQLRIGEILDWWRVRQFVPNQSLVLQADMKVPGKAWLSISIRESPDPESRDRTVRLEAIFAPNGLFGYIYWYSLYPIHLVVFRGMARSMIRIAGKQSLRD